MRVNIIDILCGIAVVAIVAGILFYDEIEAVLRLKDVAPFVMPAPPKKPRCPLCPVSYKTPAPDGTDPIIDYPSEEWIENIGSKIDGSGMCVFTSFEMACLHLGMEEMRGFRDWCAKKYPGGGYPSKLAKLVAAYRETHNLPPLQIYQYEGNDPSFLEKALRNNWMPCVTLYHSPRYGRGTIYHMVNNPHLDQKWGGILDNNFSSDYEWASREDHLKKIKLNGQYWGVAIEGVGPPPSPTN